MTMRPRLRAGAKTALRAPTMTCTWPPKTRRQWPPRSEEHTSELQSRGHLVCRLLLEKKKLLPPDRLGREAGNVLGVDMIEHHIARPRVALDGVGEDCYPAVGGVCVASEVKVVLAPLR